jgi:hypothetical protein
MAESVLVAEKRTTPLLSLGIDAPATSGASIPAGYAQRGEPQ